METLSCKHIIIQCRSLSPNNKARNVSRILWHLQTYRGIIWLVWQGIWKDSYAMALYIMHISLYTIGRDFFNRLRLSKCLVYPTVIHAMVFTVWDSHRAQQKQYRNWRNYAASKRYTDNSTWYRWMDGWMDEWMDGWMDGWIIRWIVLSYSQWTWANQKAPFNAGYDAVTDGKSSTAMH